MRVCLILEGMKNRLPSNFNVDNLLSYGSPTLSKYMKRSLKTDSNCMSPLIMNNSMQSPGKLKEAILSGKFMTLQATKSRSVSPVRPLEKPLDHSLHSSKYTSTRALNKKLSSIKISPKRLPFSSKNLN